MKIGIASTCLWRYGPEELINFASKNELYSIEFWIDHLLLFDTSYKKIAKILNRNRIIPTVHSISWDINICSFSRDVRNFSLKEIMKSIDIASELGAEIFVLHPGKMSFGRAGKGLYIDILIESFSKIYDYSRGKNIKLCIENMEPLKKELLVTPEDFLDFYDKIKCEYLYITMDIAHLGSFDKINDFYKNLYNKIVHIHVSDLNENQIHLPPGKGDLPFNKVLKLLNDKYRGIYNIEFFNYDNNPDIVIESIEFLRGLHNEKLN